MFERCSSILFGLIIAALEEAETLASDLRLKVL